MPFSNIRDKKIYLACSDNYEYSNYIQKMRNSQELFYAKIKSKGLPPSNTKIEYFEDYTHGTVTVPSLHSGLLYIFDHYFLEGMKYQNADAIIKHFSEFSRSQAHRPTLTRPANV